MEAVATTMATRLACEVVNDGIDAVEEKEGKKTKPFLCTLVLVTLLIAIFIVSRVLKS